MAFPIAPRAIFGTLVELTAKYNEAVTAINGALNGKLNAVNNPDFPITLTANAATTTLTDARLGINSVVIFDPVTANAAAELAAGTMYVLTANRRNGVYTITHANNAQADRTFRYCIIG